MAYTAEFLKDLVTILNRAGLGWPWACVKSYVATLATTVETNRIKILGRVETLSPTASFAKNSLITCAKVVYLSNAQVTGLPNNIVTEDGVDGTNTESKWAYICGEHENVSPAMETELLEKANVRDMAQYIKLTHDGNVVCQLGFGDVIGDALQPPTMYVKNETLYIK